MTKTGTNDAVLVDGDEVLLHTATREHHVAVEGNRLMLSRAGTDHEAPEMGRWVVHKVSGKAVPPRIGYRMTLCNDTVRTTGNCEADHCALQPTGACSQLQWFGRGPHESYIDRKAGAKVHQWQGAVEEQTFRSVYDSCLCINQINAPSKRAL